MKRAYSPKEIALRTYKTLPWGGRWEAAFGFPEECSVWYIGGASASGKSSFVMQLAYELTHYGQVLYLSYEEGVSQCFQERMLRFELDKRQGWFRVATNDTFDELCERLKRRGSAKFIIVDSIQMAHWDYSQVERLVKQLFPKKSFIFIGQEEKSRPMTKTGAKCKFLADVKVNVRGFKAYCQGRFNPDIGNCYVVWEEGVLRTTNNLSNNV